MLERLRLRRKRAAVPEPPPDTWQLLGVTLLLALGFAPLLAVLEPRVGAFIGLVLGLRLAAIRWPRLRPAPWMLVLLTLAGAVNVIDAYRGMAGQAPGTALLLTMMALKLLEVRARRDLRVLLLAFGFLLVVQFLFDESALRTLFMTLLLLVNLGLLYDLASGAAATGPWRRLRRSGRAAGAILAQALPLALLLFLFFPRLTHPLWDLGLENEFSITGLTETMEPGSVTDLVVSGEDALRVRFQQPPGIPTERLYWRGIVAWHTDGRRWTPARQGEFPEADTEVVAEGETLDYSVALEPTDQHWLIGLDLPVGVPRDAMLTGDLTVRAARPVESLRFYRMSSAPAYRTEGLSLDEEAAATALPANVTPRMRALVAGWLTDEPDPQQVVQRALDYFNSEPFFYTLLPPELGDNPSDSFLFETKTGFCEHYASSFALLMRIAGIPSRIVLGYLGGEYNPLSKDYVVRQSDAHAWTEVWLPGRGWVRVDPTAAIDPSRVDDDARMRAMGAGAPVRFRSGEQGALASLVYDLHLFADALGAGWRQWVVGFSRYKQQRLLEALGLGALREYGLALLLGLGAMTVLIALSLMLARRGGGGSDPVQRLYHRFLRRLARLGLDRRRDEGPVEHRDRVIAARPDLTGPVDAVLAHYLRLRFAGASPEGRRALRQAVREFKPLRRPAAPSAAHASTNASATGAG